MGEWLLWIVILFLLTFISRKVIWLKSIGAILKRLRSERSEFRLGDVAEIKAVAGDQIDLDELENITAQLHELGFHILGHVLIKITYDPILTPNVSSIVSTHENNKSISKTDTQSNAIGRIFAHSTHGCYASAYSVIAVTHFDPIFGLKDRIKIVPFRTTILSVENLDENSWRYANTNREVDPFSLLLSHPRKLGRHMIDATPKQLFQAHLAERDDITKHGNFHWDAEPSIEKYLSIERSAIDYIHRVTKKLKPLPVAFHLLTYKYKTMTGGLMNRGIPQK